jgi:hypothetical protein
MSLWSKISDADLEEEVGRACVLTFRTKREPEYAASVVEEWLRRFYLTYYRGWDPSRITDHKRVRKHAALRRDA